MERDTAGNIIEPPFLYPCPTRCGLTGGCPQCRRDIELSGGGSPPQRVGIQQTMQVITVNEL